MKKSRSASGETGSGVDSLAEALPALITRCQPLRNKLKAIGRDYPKAQESRQFDIWYAFPILLLYLAE